MPEKKILGDNPTNLGKITGKIVSTVGTRRLKEANKALSEVATTDTTGENKSAISIKVNKERSAALRKIAEGNDMQINSAVDKDMEGATNKLTKVLKSSKGAAINKGLGVK